MSPDISHSVSSGSKEGSPPAEKYHFWHRMCCIPRTHIAFIKQFVEVFRNLWAGSVSALQGKSLCTQPSFLATHARRSRTWKRRRWAPGHPLPWEASPSDIWKWLSSRLLPSDRDWREVVFRFLSLWEDSEWDQPQSPFPLSWRVEVGQKCLSN